MTPKSKVALLSVTVLLLVWGCRAEHPMRQATTATPAAPQVKHVVVNEAVRTLLYLPLYHAQESGCFTRRGLKVDIVTGGTAAASFAALTTGHASFSQADPMYVPIAREKGTANARVVAQVVGRIAVWAVTRDASLRELTRASLKGRVISTHKRPMTAYAYTLKLVTELGLTPGKDVKILENQPGTELAPLFRGDADVAFTLEPQVSQAEANGAHVVLSLPDRYGDQIFTGLMTTQDVDQKDPAMVEAVVRCYQESVAALHGDAKEGIATAKKYFPSIDPNVLPQAVKRLVEDEVIPKSVLVSEDSWNRAMRVRLDEHDLSKPASRADNCDLPLMERIASGQK